MELLTLAAIIGVIIVTIIGLIVVIKKVSTFYKHRFQFVLLFVVAFLLLPISALEGITRSCKE